MGVSATSATTTTQSPRPVVAGPYLSQLDGLRALFVTTVLVQHFTAEYYPSLNPVDWGKLGVRLFFVLSGYLITGILLRCRDRMTLRDAALRFYGRRVLRIFPVYYVALLAAALLSMSPVPETFWWHASYLSNLYFAIRGDWHGCVSHLWTLAVEEQFYLLWPWIVLLVPRARLLPVILALVAVGIATRLLAMVVSGNEVVATVMFYSCLDTLGMGALLAVLQDRPGPSASQATQRLCRWGRNLGLPLLVGILIVGAMGVAPILFVTLRDLGVALVGVWIIEHASRNAPGLWGRTLSWAPMVYVGRLSYSIYVIHLFVPLLLTRIAYFMGGQIPQAPWARVVLFHLVTLALAVLSWHLLEKPINSLKDWIPYLPLRRAPASPAPERT